MSLSTEQTNQVVVTSQQPTIYNTKFDEFIPQEYLDGDDCLDLYDEMVESEPTMSLSHLQEALIDENKQYTIDILQNAIALVNPEHFSSLLRKDFPLIWFICTCFDARDSEQVLFIVCDVDEQMGLTKEQYRETMSRAGFQLSISDVNEVFEQFAIEENGRISFTQFHSIIEQLFRWFLAM